MSFNKVNSDGSITRVAGGTLYADAPVGAIIPYGGTTAPDGFLLCQGQAVSRTDYAELFTVIGTAFGTGDGSATFNLPDLRETVPVGVSQSTRSDIATHDVYTIGQFKDDQLQEHRHSLPNDINAAFGENTSAFGGGGGSPFTSTGTISSGRTGTTTHGKQLGVNYIIKATQVGVPADFAPVDTIESGNMKAVTSNAVAEAIEAKLFTGSATKSAYVTAGDITWQWTGRICRVLFEGVKIAANTPFLSDICTDLPPSNGTEFLTVCAEYPTTTAAGFLRADRNIGKLLADASVGGQTVEVTLYASVSYITSEDAHQI